MSTKNDKKEENSLKSQKEPLLEIEETSSFSHSSSSKRDYFLPISILIAGVLIAGSLIYSTGKKTVGPAETKKTDIDSAVQAPAAVQGVEIGDSVILGDPKAPVTFIEYADYQCPFCTSFFQETEPLLIKDYVDKGKMKMVYKDFAFLDQFAGGKNESHLAAEAAVCSADQGKFWDYHDLIFKTELADQETNQGKSENNGNLNVNKLESLASELGLNKEQFNSCLESNKYKDKIQKEVAEAQALGVKATPTFFINGQKFEGALPYPQFKATIDNLLK